MTTRPGTELSHRARLRAVAVQAMRDRGLEPDFPPDALAEVASLAGAPGRSEEPVRDLRDRLWCSIDNDASRDLDQLSVAEALAGGSVKVLVAVADVDVVVTKGSPIDRHAAVNTTSVYTPAVIFPMLPERLSTDLTSLADHADRLAIVVEFVVSADGALTGEDVYGALVRNGAKLAYNAVGAWLAGGGPLPDEAGAVPGMDAQLRLQDRIAQAIGRVRHEHGALEFETPEVEPRFDGDTLSDLRPELPNRATRLIENLMIAANGVVARFLDRKGVASIRRVVKAPARWDRIVLLAAHTGDHLPATPDSLALAGFLKERRAADPDGFVDLSHTVIKLLGPGEYVVERPGGPVPGHFGLAVRDYTHSTAPNRRYPDLLSQRLVKAALAGHPAPYTDDELERLAAHCTSQEDAANRVERQVRKSAAALLIESRVGEKFDAMVTGVSPQGTFVRVASPPIEGKLVVGEHGLDVGDHLAGAPGARGRRPGLHRLRRDSCIAGGREQPDALRKRHARPRPYAFLRFPADRCRARGRAGHGRHGAHPGSVRAAAARRGGDRPRRRRHRPLGRHRRRRPFPVPAAAGPLHADRGALRASRTSSARSRSAPIRSRSISRWLVAISEQVIVTAVPEPVIGAPSATAQASLSRDVIQSAMLPNNTFDDVLPMLPNVVRGPDGLISVAGARAPQGQMLVNGLSQTDPVLGEPDIQLPVDPIASVTVLANGYPSEYGQAAGGVTLVEMRPGTDQFHVNVNSFFPRLHFTTGGIDGVEAWEPNFGVSGPIVKGRLWFTQGADYRYVRSYYDTVAGPEANKYTAVLSWSSLDASLTPDHHLSLWASIDPQTTDHVNVGAFTPAPTVPGLRRGGPRVAITDRLVLGADTTLESSLQAASLPTEVTSAGRQPYAIGHDVATGDFFNQQDRTASRVELSDTYTHGFARGASHHVVKAGGHVASLAFSGTNTSAPVSELRSDGTLARTIDFAGSPHLAAHGYEAALFLQDTWTPRPGLSVEAGVRYDTATLADRGVVAPRLGVTWTIDEKTTFSAGAGVFADKVMLAAAAFPGMQSRTVREYDASGALVGAPEVYVNGLQGPLLMPRADSWHAQIDRRFENGWIARVSYQDRSGSDEPVIDPVAGANGQGALLLSSTGRSRARSLETTVGYRSGSSGQSVYFSYVRASTTGNLNDFASIAGNAIEPFVQPDQTGPLSTDVPDRLLAWALLKLPWQLDFAPSFEVRSGFPFSPIDEAWRYVGARNGGRFPAFSSADMFVSRVVKLPFGLPYARIGLKLYDIVGTGNARDIQRDVARADYGSLYNPIPRDYMTVFELLWGRR